MEASNKGGASSAAVAPEGVADNDVKEMTADEYAAFLVKKATPPEATESKDETTQDTTSEEDTSTEKQPSEEDKAAESSTDEQPEQSESTDEAPEQEEVLSKSEPIPADKFAKWQADVQKRIDKLTAEKKSAEALAEQLKAKAPETAPEPIVVPVGNPDDKTATALSESDLAKVEREAQAALDFIEDNRILIQKALLRDEETVTIGGQEVPITQITKAEREAKRHLDRYIPARRKFLLAVTAAQSEAQKVAPALFDKGAPEYQEYQSFRRTNPAFNALPNADYIYAMYLKGLAATKTEQDTAKKATVTPAAAKAPKTAGDTGASAAAKQSVTRTASSEKTKAKAELEKAMARFQKTGSADDYSKVLIIQSRLKKL